MKITRFPVVRRATLWLVGGIATVGIILLIASSPQARLSLSQLLAQITSLEARVEALETSGADVRVINTPAEPVPVVLQKGILDIVEIIEDNVPSRTDVNVFTVPANRGLVITDVMISWEVGGTSCSDVRILRNGLPATSIITVPAFSTFSHAFATGIHFGAGETVAVSNGITGCILHFYLRGFLTNE